MSKKLIIAIFLLSLIFSGFPLLAQDQPQYNDQSAQRPVREVISKEEMGSFHYTEQNSTGFNKPDTSLLKPMPIYEFLGLERKVIRKNSYARPWGIYVIGNKTIELVNQIAREALKEGLESRDTYLTWLIHKATTARKDREERAGEILDLSKHQNMDNYIEEQATVCAHTAVLFQFIDATLGNTNYLVVNQADNHLFNLRKRLDSGAWEFFDAYQYRHKGIISEEVLASYLSGGSKVMLQEGDKVKGYPLNAPGRVVDIYISVEGETGSALDYFRKHPIK